MQRSEKQVSMPTPLQQRVMVFTRALQDLLQEVEALQNERDHLATENVDLKQELAKLKIQARHDQVAKKKTQG